MDAILQHKKQFVFVRREMAFLLHYLKKHLALQLRLHVMAICRNFVFSYVYKITLLPRIRLHTRSGYNKFSLKQTQHGFCEKFPFLEFHDNPSTYSLLSITMANCDHFFLVRKLGKFVLIGIFQKKNFIKFLLRVICNKNAPIFIVSYIQGGQSLFPRKHTFSVSASQTVQNLDTYAFRTTNYPEKKPENYQFL